MKKYWYETDISKWFLWNIPTKIPRYILNSEFKYKPNDTKFYLFSKNIETEDWFGRLKEAQTKRS